MIYTILTVAAILTAGVFAMSFVCYRGAFYNDVKKTDLTFTLLPGKQYQDLKDVILESVKTADKLSYDEAYARSVDNLLLYARFYRGDDDKPIIISFHGYKSCSLRDLSGEMQMFLENGYGVLMPDQRGHGKSDGKTISFGIKERYDALTWIRYINDKYKGKKKIILFGVSLGAETVIMASSLVLPKNVIGIIADSPFSSPKDIVLKVTKEKKFSPKLVYPFFIIGAKLYGKFNLNETSAVTAVKRCKIPILIIHGTEDGYVPYKMSEEIKNANPEMVSLSLFEGAGHGLSIAKDYDKYRSTVLGYIENRLTPDAV